MILYFTDKYMTILRVAGDKLKDGLRIEGDLKTSELAYGSDIFECSVCYKSSEYALIDRLSDAGGYILRANTKNGGKYECYTILESNNDTEDCTCWVSGRAQGLTTLMRFWTPTKRLTP